MIYQAFELARRSTRPVAKLLEFTHQLARHDRNPWRDTYAHRALAVACEIPLRGLKNYQRRPFSVRRFEDDALLEENVVYGLPFADLVNFPVPGGEGRPKVLLAAALSGHYATLLQDTIRGLARDFDPYITDWKDARQVPVEAGDFGLDDYIAYLVEFLEVLGPGTHLVATCQAAPPALVAAAVLAQRNPELVPASLTLMAGPIDTRVNKNILNKITDKLPLDWFAMTTINRLPGGYPGSGRRVYPGFMQLSGFIMMNPLPHFKKYWSFVKDSVSGNEDALERFREFYDEYFSVLDMTETFYVESLQKIFFEHHIPTGQMTFRGEPVDFSLLENMPLLTVEGENDGFCPLGQTEAAHDICPNIPDAKRRHHVQPGVGHYGIFSGSRYQNDIYPVIREFIQAAE
ncbi:MAG: polyhydroxyalkanoate depolymerase [Novosphingobium sp.]|nr:polyhydroxyalkanoate depolymerase [Novosphingobium sp.]